MPEIIKNHRYPNRSIIIIEWPIAVARARNLNPPDVPW